MLKQLNAMKRKPLVTFVCLTVFVGAGYAQDIITKKSGEDIKAKVLEVGAEQVRYKKFERPNGPDYIIAGTEVFMVKYASGNKDVFERNPATGKIQIRHIIADTPPENPIPETTPATTQTTTPATTAPTTPATAKPSTPATTVPTPPAKPQPTTAPTATTPTTATTPATPATPATAAAKPAAAIPSDKQIRQASNGTFTLLKLDGTSVSFRASIKTPLYMVSLISGRQTVKAAYIHNTKGDIVFSSGATAIAGSSLSMGKSGMMLQKGTEAQCGFKDIPSGFMAQTIEFRIDDRAAAMSYDIASGAWINPQQDTSVAQTASDSSDSSSIQSQSTATADSAPESTSNTIRYSGGICRLSRINLSPWYSPANMSNETEKSFAVSLTYTVTNGILKSLDELYSDGMFVSPDGKSYKAGAALRNETFYTLVVAVPKDVDVLTLKFVFKGQTLLLSEHKD